MRHRTTILDAFLLAMALAVLTFVALEVDVFRSPDAPEVKGLEIDELLMFATTLLFGLLIIGWRFMIAQRREISRRMEAERRAHNLAMLDSLTGLPNRRHFDQELKSAIAAPPGADAAHATFMIDLNGFKKINDIFGHGTGDGVLVQVAERMIEAMRTGDLIARIGGDEFAILARHINGPDEASSMALRIIRTLEEPITVGAHQHLIGVGIGIALMPRDGDTAEEILRKADISLYRAKAEPKSALCFFEPEMDAVLRERELIERELKAALDAGAIRPFYQPLVDLDTRSIIGFEALPRWTHPTLDDIPTERFLPIADSIGLMPRLTDQLLKQACRDACDWPEQLVIAFTVPPSQLHDPSLALRLMAILASSGLTPQRLELELTESALVRDLDKAQEILGALRLAGVRIALKDFGTGYSTLYHLRNVQVDKIKVDRSFVSTMDHQPEAAALVRAIVGLGTGLGLTVTAAGVENAEQEMALRANGCQQGQGVLFSEAVSAGRALKLIQESRAAGQAA